MEEFDLGIAKAIEYDEHKVIIGISRKYLRLFDGKLEFQAKITEQGQLVLLGPYLHGPSKTGVKLDNDP